MLNSDHKFIAVVYWILRKVVGIPVKLFFINKVNGLSNIPISGPAIIAFNHQSFLDFICFAAISPRNIHYLSAEKFFDHYLWKYLMIFTGQIKVQRNLHEKSAVHKSVERHVKIGTLIGVFPEGTRSPDKFEMLKAFTGIAQFSLKHHIPIIPVGIIGTFDMLSKHNSNLKIRKIVSIDIGKPIIFDAYYDKHEDKDICTYVTECVMYNIGKLSNKKYIHYESKQFKENSHN